MITILIVAAVVTFIVMAARRLPAFRSSGNLDPTPTMPQPPVRIGPSDSNVAGSDSKKRLDKILGKIRPHLKDFDWKWPLAVVVSEVMLECRFPKQFGILTTNPWFWVAHVVGLLVFALFLEPDKKAKDKDEKKLTTAGKLILVSLALAIAANFFGVSSDSSLSTGSAKHFISSLNPFGSSLPEENEAMKEKVVKFWRDNLGDNIDDRAALIGVAGFSHFNQFESDGKTPLRWKINGREKVGVMAIDEKLWDEVGNDFSAADSADNNLKVALYLYKTYGLLPWSSYLFESSRVVAVPAGDWSEKIPIGRSPMHTHPSEDMIVADDLGRQYKSIVSEPQNHPSTEWIKYKTISGKSAIVLVGP